MGITLCTVLQNSYKEDVDFLCLNIKKYFKTKESKYLNYAISSFKQLDEDIKLIRIKDIFAEINDLKGDNNDEKYKEIFDSFELDSELTEADRDILLNNYFCLMNIREDSLEYIQHPFFLKYSKEAKLEVLLDKVRNCDIEYLIKFIEIDSSILDEKLLCYVLESNSFNILSKFKMLNLSVDKLKLDYNDYLVKFFESFFSRYAYTSQMIDESNVSKNEVAVLNEYFLAYKKTDKWRDNKYMFYMNSAYRAMFLDLFDDLEKEECYVLNMIIDGYYVDDYIDHCMISKESFISKIKEYIAKQKDILVSGKKNFIDQAWRINFEYLKDLYSQRYLCKASEQEVYQELYELILDEESVFIFDNLSFNYVDTDLVFKIWTQDNFEDKRCSVFDEFIRFKNERCFALAREFMNFILERKEDKDNTDFYYQHWFIRNMISGLISSEFVTKNILNKYNLSYSELLSFIFKYKRKYSEVIINQNLIEKIFSDDTCSVENVASLLVLGFEIPDSFYDFVMDNESEIKRLIFSRLDETSLV